MSPEETVTALLSEKDAEQEVAPKLLSSVTTCLLVRMDMGASSNLMTMPEPLVW